MSRIALTVPITTVTVSGAHATLTASVTNRGSVPDRIVLGAFAPSHASRDAASASNATTWTTIDTPLREVGAGATEQYTVTFTPPDAAAAGTYPVRFIAYSANSAPEESADQARQVDVVIPTAASVPPVTKKSRWPLAVMAALVLIVAIFAFIIWPKPPPGGGQQVPPDPGSPPSVPAAAQPDLLVGDIILNQPADANGDIIMSVVVQNIEAGTTQGFEVACETPCQSSPMYFWPGQLAGGLGAGQSATVGGNALQSLSGCTPQSSRLFACTVDPANLVEESNESNNTMEKILLTGR